MFGDCSKMKSLVVDYSFALLKNLLSLCCKKKPNNSMDVFLTEVNLFRSVISVRDISLFFFSLQSMNDTSGFLRRNSITSFSDLQPSKN